MRRIIVLVVVGLLFATAGSAQDIATGNTDRVAVVGFMQGQPVNSALSGNPGAAGLTRLTEIFRSYGTTTRVVAPDEPIPPDIDALVIVQPRRPFPVATTAYLWDYLENGGHLLLALDPNGHNGVNTERSNGGISQLLAREYGLQIVDDFLLEPWFDVQRLSDVVTSWTIAHPEDFFAHDIVQPLLDYSLPLRFWGARSVIVDSLTGNADTFPLIYVERPHGETGRVNLRSDDPAQLEMNIGRDNQGRLMLAAIAQHNVTGSRVALIGDSEMLLNIFGLTRMVEQETVARYAGNEIFARRLVGWLVGAPVDEWVNLPDTFTPVVVDGSVDDWAAEWRAQAGTPAAVEPGGNGVSSLSIAYDDHYLYAAIETLKPAQNDELRIDLYFEDSAQIHIAGEIASVVDDTQRQPISGAVIASGNIIEVQLPLRVIGDEPVIDGVCVRQEDALLRACSAPRIPATATGTVSPLPFGEDSGISTFTSNAANLRTVPDQSSDVIERLPARTLFRVIGRTDDGGWLRVENGRYTGWITRALLVINAPVESLSVVE